MLNSEALTKIQALILVIVVVFALIGGVAIHFLLGEQEQLSEPIRIGLLSDLNMEVGKMLYQGAVLATEQVNAEGGVLGRNLTIVAEDDDSSTPTEPTVASSALTKLITVDMADFVISLLAYSFVYQEGVAEYQRILFHGGDNRDMWTQKVLDDYDKYKYYFRIGWTLNESITNQLVAESFVVCREHTGFNKIAILALDVGTGDAMFSGLIAYLDEFGFDVVHTALIPFLTMDFSSYFAKAEAAGAEIIFPMIFGQAVIPFAKEYYDRQSPTVLWGLPGVSSDVWEATAGKCDDVTCSGHSVTVGYPLTSKVKPTRDAYFERWGEEIDATAAFAYDIVRFILPDAIERAGTIETDAVIEALEETEIETSLARKFAFTSSHDTLVTMNGEDYWLYVMFQWQDGEQAPVYPKKIMEEAGATYTYPDWDGPWSK